MVHLSSPLIHTGALIPTNCFATVTVSEHAQDNCNWLTYLKEHQANPYMCPSLAPTLKTIGPGSDFKPKAVSSGILLQCRMF